MWFTEDDGDRIGRITRTGAVREFVSGIRPGANPFGITRGTDDAMWFTEFAGDRIARITPTRIVTEYVISTGSRAMGILAAPGRKLWVAACGRNRILRVMAPPPPAVDASVAHSFTTRGASTMLTRRLASDVPRYARVELRCKGGGCREDLARYTLEMGTQNRGLAVANHVTNRHAAAFAALLDEVGVAAQPPGRAVARAGAAGPPALGHGGARRSVRAPGRRPHRTAGRERGRAGRRAGAVGGGAAGDEALPVRRRAGPDRWIPPPRRLGRPRPPEPD